ncbi:hypothetical protein [Candidatus Methylacidithermus pantelleriae]|uniref:hypothetical protein n=1 Tax=Candidatus Methylacidithermus pantelleriae TaxID=2744239 RepID=UPI001BD1C2DB|nr:hypothetical protein [Candidatus Methylacidithermus pantelleriae]
MEIPLDLADSHAIAKGVPLRHGEMSPVRVDADPSGKRACHQREGVCASTLGKHPQPLFAPARSG